MHRIRSKLSEPAVAVALTVLHREVLAAEPERSQKFRTSLSPVQQFITESLQVERPPPPVAILIYVHLKQLTVELVER